MLGLKVLAVIVIVLAVSAALLWWRFHPDEKGRIVPPFERIDMAYLETFVAGAESAERLVVYEGLPNKSWGGGLYRAELERTDLIEVKNYHFYAAPLVINADDMVALNALLKRDPLFVEWGGMKLCGGYHPDFALEWRDGDKSYFALICLTCHEVKMYGPDGRLYADIADETYVVIKTILGKYRVNRPVPPETTDDPADSEPEATPSPEHPVNPYTSSAQVSSSSNRPER